MELSGHANYLGLDAEEIGPSGEALGSFPQALIHPPSSAPRRTWTARQEGNPGQSSELISTGFAAIAPLEGFGIMPGRTGKAPRTFRRLRPPALYRELTAGRAAYDALIGRWWHWRSTDPAHVRAYRAIADHLESALPEPPKTIVDYGCGSGSLLTRLYARFPQSTLIGLDGSSLLLRIAGQRFRRLDRDWAERVQLIERGLPDFSLPQGVADLAILCFPHILPDRGDGLGGGAQRGVSEAEVAVARVLAVAGEPDSDAAEAASLCEDLLRGKIIARNLRGLLRRGGLCMRVEYTDLGLERNLFTRRRSEFEAGALEEPVGGRRAQRLFGLVRSTYVRSRVVEDVYQQTGDEADGRGGYSITLLEAL